MFIPRVPCPEDPAGIAPPTLPAPVLRSTMEGGSTMAPTLIGGGSPRDPRPMRARPFQRPGEPTPRWKGALAVLAWLALMAWALATLLGAGGAFAPQG